MADELIELGTALIAIAITVLVVLYLLISVILENKNYFTSRETPRKVDYDYDEDEEEVYDEETEERLTPIQRSCYACLNYHFPRRYCMKKEDYIGQDIYYESGINKEMKELGKPANYNECEFFHESDMADIEEKGPNSVYIGRATAIIFILVSLAIFTALFLLAKFIEEMPVLGSNVVHLYAVLLWINGAFFSWLVILALGEDYYRRGLISPIDYNIPIIGNLVGGIGAAIAHILYLYGIHKLEYLGFILIFLGAVLSLKDVSSIDILSIPYEGRTLLETSPLTEEDIQSISENKEIGLQKPHAPDFAGKNKPISMSSTAINKSDQDKSVILSYVSASLEPETDSIKVLIPAHQKTEKTFVAFTKRTGTEYVSFRLADQDENVLEEWNELITVQPEFKGHAFRLLAFLLTAAFSFIQILIA